MSDELERWEYRVQTIGSTILGTKDEHIQAVLNEWGEEGWKAFAVVADHMGKSVETVRKLTQEIDGVNWHPVAGVNGYCCDVEATVKIRYNHPGTSATVTVLEDNRARIRLHEPQRAVTPGQAAVIYEGDVVLGGGWICRGESARKYKAAAAPA